jgi:hypothetical protein
MSGAIDGISVLDGILPILRALDYSLSRSDRSLTYTADPQAVIEDENPEEALKRLVKSPAGTWIIGKGGKIYYLEIDGKGIELQGQFADRMRKAALEICRVALTDPDSIRGGEMSGYALRMVHESMIDLADEQRIILGKVMHELLCKILAAAVISNARGQSLNMPDVTAATAASGWDWARRTVERLVARARGTAGQTQGAGIKLWHPWIAEPRTWPQPETVTGAWDMTPVWGEYFDPSPQEELQKMQTVAAAKGAGVASLETCVRTASTVMDSGNVEEEIDRVRKEQNLDLIPDGEDAAADGEA